MMVYIKLLKCNHIYFPVQKSLNCWQIKKKKIVIKHNIFLYNYIIHLKVIIAFWTKLGNNNEIFAVKPQLIVWHWNKYNICI